MPIPEFIVSLRSKVGNELLWLTGVTAAVFNPAGQVLLGRRSDTGNWALVSGILEPGEQPGVAIAREIAEETGIDAVIESLAALNLTEKLTYPNGDQAQYLDLLFIARGDGDPHPADDESTAAGWFDLDALPQPLADSSRARLQLAADFLANPSAGTIFER